MENQTETKGVERINYVNNNGSNTIGRESVIFSNRLNMINEKREEIGLRRLSRPKITQLIIRHNNWKSIEDDLISYSPNKYGEENDE